MNRRRPLYANVCLLPFSPLPSLSDTETLHSRIPSPQKPHRRVEQRQMAALPQNNKSSNCLGIFYLIYNSLLSFIYSSYITESLRNDSPKEETVGSCCMSAVQLFEMARNDQQLLLRANRQPCVTPTMTCSTAPSSCAPEEHKISGDPLYE